MTDDASTVLQTFRWASGAFSRGTIIRHPGTPYSIIHDSKWTTSAATLLAFHYLVRHPRWQWLGISCNHSLLSPVFGNVVDNLFCRGKSEMLGWLGGRWLPFYCSIFQRGRQICRVYFGKSAECISNTSVPFYVSLQIIRGHSFDSIFENPTAIWNWTTYEKKKHLTR